MVEWDVGAGAGYFRRIKTVACDLNQQWYTHISLLSTLWIKVKLTN